MRGKYGDQQTTETRKTLHGQQFRPLEEGRLNGALSYMKHSTRKTRLD